MATQLLEQVGSLNLIHSPGDDKNPETFTVQLRDTPHICGSLEVARDWFEVDGIRLNGSQAVTVTTWHEKYL